MKIYLVGGAVRDKLLKLPVKEKDWVVVGATPEDMLQLGYKPVGKEFPVFLHPETKEEYAMARTEKKVAKGYKGFTFYTDKSVTLEQDLLRRDLTINAIAESDQGNIVDPFHGQEDLKQKIIRHVSPAFSEDPVRILRLARFASRFVDFTVAAETTELMKAMVKAGEVDALVAERVWQECRRAFENAKPSRFFKVLSSCHALANLFPMIEKQGKSILTLLDDVCVKTNKSTLRFAAVCRDMSLEEVKALVQRYKIPNDYSDLAKLLITHQAQYQHFSELSPEEILQFFVKSDALRRPDRFFDFIDLCGWCFDSVANKTEMQKLLNAIKQIDIAPLQQQGLKGADFAAAIQALRIKTIKEHLA